MNIKIREQSGTDAVRKFDYQMAVALDYLLSEIDSNAIVLIETLEDFAVFRNVGMENEMIDVYQVKTKDKGLYSKSTLNSDNVLGKIILTDFYFDSKANTLNIVCNTFLKGSSTEELEDFVLVDKLTSIELKKMKESVIEYLERQLDFSGNPNNYWGKLIYIKSSLPFSGKTERYEETLVGKTNNTIAHYLGNENHSINPKAVFNALKLLIDRKRRTKIVTSEIEINAALEKKGISSSQLKEVIDKAVESTRLSKKEILEYAADIFDPKEFMLIKQEYSTYLSYKANLADLVFIEAKSVVEETVQKLAPQYDSLSEVVKYVAYDCEEKIPYYSLPVIQIIAIEVVYS